MAISPGDNIPDGQLTTMTSEGPQPMSVEEIFSGRKIVLFAVPGAFTPTCHNQHLPGFLQHADELKSNGVDTIACISVNDVFVMDAWAKQSGAKDKILFLADGNGDFAKSIGMELDASAFGMGIRSKRYSMVVDDGVVKSLHVEPEAGQADETSAEKILKDL